MSDNRYQEAIYVDRKLGLVIPNGTPEVIARLALDLYRFGDLGRESDALDVAQTFIVLSDVAHMQINVSKPLDWSELALMRIDEVTEVTIRLLEEASEKSSWVAARYGLYQLNRALTEDLGPDGIMQAVALAGHCAGLVAFAKGLTQGMSHTARRRWDALEEIRNDVQERYRREKESGGVTKADFIRSIRSEVLDRTKAHKYATNETSVDSRIRKWLRGL